MRFVPHRLGLGGTVAVVVDGFISGRRHFARADRAEEYFDWLVRKHGQRGRVMDASGRGARRASAGLRATEGSRATRLARRGRVRLESS